jgi:hypothetical protein
MTWTKRTHENDFISTITTQQLQIPQVATVRHFQIFVELEAEHSQNDEQERPEITANCFEEAATQPSEKMNVFL